MPGLCDIYNLFREMGRAGCADLRWLFLLSLDSDRLTHSGLENSWVALSCCSLSIRTLPCHFQSKVIGKAAGMMQKRHGGHLLVECLRVLGAAKGFGVPGESYLAVLDGLFDTRGDLDLVLCRNEGGASFMAAAYGKLTGQPGLCFVTRGPGATNASIGVHTAMQDSAPMILFVGQIDTSMRDREAFQEVDYRAFFGPIAKWATEIDHVDRIPEILARAWSTAISGRPGPVVIALPEDMLAMAPTVPALTRPVSIVPPVHPVAFSESRLCMSSGPPATSAYG